jgi:hypothetical protein
MAIGKLEMLCYRQIPFRCGFGEMLTRCLFTVEAE